MENSYGNKIFLFDQEIAKEEMFTFIIYVVVGTGKATWSFMLPRV